MAGKVVVVRMSSYIGVLNDYEVAIDGKNLFYIGSGEYTEFALREGGHYITLKYFSGAWFEDTLEFIVEDSETIYFFISPYHWTGAKISLSNETEAKKHIERAKFIDLKNETMKVISD